MTKLAQLIGRILAADVRKHPVAPESGVTGPGNARTVVGRLHPRMDTAHTCDRNVIVRGAA